MALHDDTRNDVGPVLGALAALGLALALVGVQRTNRRQARSSDTWKPFATYLRDHLSGADTAIQTVEGLRSTLRGKPEGALFDWLYQEFREERGVLEGLLAELGYTSLSAKRVAGRATGSALRLVAGGEPGELSLFRTLEALAIGVQGKRCLWRAAQALDALPHPTGQRSFLELEADAVRQWEAIDHHRRSLVPATFGV